MKLDWRRRAFQVQPWYNYNHTSIELFHAFLSIAFWLTLIGEECMAIHNSTWSYRRDNGSLFCRCYNALFWNWKPSRGVLIKVATWNLYKDKHCQHFLLLCTHARDHIARQEFCGCRDNHTWAHAGDDTPRFWHKFGQVNLLSCDDHMFTMVLDRWALVDSDTSPIGKIRKYFYSAVCISLALWLHSMTLMVEKSKLVYQQLIPFNISSLYHRTNTLTIVCAHQWCDVVVLNAIALNINFHGSWNTYVHACR